MDHRKRASVCSLRYAHGIDISLVQKGFVSIGIVAYNSFDEFVLTHHGEEETSIVKCPNPFEPMQFVAKPETGTLKLETED